MPLEVRELNIKVKVGSEATTADSGASGGEGGGEDRVQEIVEKVLEALEKQAER